MKPKTRPVKVARVRDIQTIKKLFCHFSREPSGHNRGKVLPSRWVGYNAKFLLILKFNVFTCTFIQNKWCRIHIDTMTNRDKHFFPPCTLSIAKFEQRCIGTFKLRKEKKSQELVRYFFFVFVRFIRLGAVISSNVKGMCKEIKKS